MSPVGFGNPSAKVAVYIENRPPMDEFVDLQQCVGLNIEDIHRINQLCGNHWRKIFNCLAKLMWRLLPQNFSDWRDYRDQQLLTASGNECLLFSPPKLSQLDEKKVHIVVGKTYSAQQDFFHQLHWIDKAFARLPNKALWVSPYLDYRQLTNQRIELLAQLIGSAAP